MNYRYLNQANYPIIEFCLNRNKSIQIETGAMAYKSANIVLEGKRNGSFLSAMAKNFVGGENYFITTVISTASNQVVGVAPHGISEIKEIVLDGSHNWFLEDGVYLASTGSVSYEVVRQKGIANSLLAGTGGFFILKTTSIGTIFLESFGSILEFELKVGEEFIIDNSHIIAWKETVNHKIEAGSGTFGFKSGEGIVTRLSGHGKVLIQTRQVSGFVKSIVPFIPKQK